MSEDYCLQNYVLFDYVVFIHQNYLNVFYSIGGRISYKTLICQKESDTKEVHSYIFTINYKLLIISLIVKEVILFCRGYV